MYVPSGAVWIWDDARADVMNCHLQSTETYVVLADGKALAELQARFPINDILSVQSKRLLLKSVNDSVQGCIIQGKAYTTDQSQAVAWQAANEITEPKHHIGVPPEDGPFEFVPNKFTRKQ